MRIRDWSSDVCSSVLTSQIASVQSAAGDVLGLFEKYGVDSMLACFSELIDYSDKRTRDEIRSIPDGTYTHEEPVLDDGACGGPYKLKLKIVKTGRSEEHTSELQSLMRISYAVFCLKKKELHRK